MDLQRAAGILQLLHALDEMGGPVVGIDGCLILPVLDDVGRDPVLGISSAIGDAAGFLAAATSSAVACFRRSRCPGLTCSVTTRWMGSDIGGTSLISVLYSAVYVTEAVSGQRQQSRTTCSRAGQGLGGGRLLFDGGVVVDTIKKFS